MSKHHRGGRPVLVKKTNDVSGSEKTTDWEEKPLDTDNADIGQTEEAATEAEAVVEEATPEVAATEEVTPDAEAATEEATPEAEAATEEATPEAEATTEEAAPETEAAIEEATPEAEAAAEEAAPETAAVEEAAPEEAATEEAAPEAEVTAEANTFDTESGQMAFIEGVTAVENKEEETPVEENTDIHPQQIGFADEKKEEGAEKVKKEKVKKAKTEKPMDKTKKKRGFCFHCCMSLVIFNFACTLILLCVGWIMGDQYCRRQLGLSLGETFGVYTGLTNSSSKMVTNRYAETDEQGFYDRLGKALLLKDGALDGEKFKQTLSDGISEAVGYENPEEGDIGDAMLDFAVDALKRENLDMGRINDLDLDDPEATIITITDKQLAAFLNGIVAAAADNLLTEMLDTPENRDIGIDPDKLDFKEYVKLDQIIFIDDDKTADTLRATVSVRFGKALSDMKAAIDMDKFSENLLADAPDQVKSIAKSFSGMMFSLARSILPSALYLTVDIPLSDTSVSPTIYINNMGKGKMDNFYHLMNKVGVDIKGEIDKVFVADDGAVKSVIDSINSTVDIEEMITPGAMRADIYDILIGVTKLNYDVVDGVETLKPQSERITSSDILGSLRLLLSDGKQYKDEFSRLDYSYKSYDIDSDGKIVLPSSKDEMAKRYQRVTGEELDRLIDKYEEEILLAFADAYGLKTTISHPNDGYDLEDIIDTFRGGDLSADDIQKMFDTEKLRQVICGEAEGIELNDREIAALFAKMLPTLLEEADAGIAPSDVNIEFIDLEEKNGHNFLNIALSLNLRSLFDSFDVDEKVSKLIGNLLADDFVITLGVDITLGATERERSTVMFNGVKAEALDNLMRALGVFKDENDNSLTLGEFLDDSVLSGVREVIDQLYENLPGLKLKESDLVFPDVFRIVSDLIVEQYPDMEPEEFKSALQVVFKENPLTSDGAMSVYIDGSFDDYIARSEKAVLSELYSKYGISNENGNKEYSLAQMLAIIGIGDKTKLGVTEDIDFLGLVDKDILKANALSTSASWQSDLKVGLTNKPYDEDNDGCDMFSAVIRTVVFDSVNVDFGELSEQFDKESLLYAKISESDGSRYLTLGIKLGLKELIGDTQEDSMESLIADLLPETVLVELKADITVGRTEGFNDAVIINKNESKTQSLLDLLNTLEIDIDIERNLLAACDGVRSAFAEIDDNFKGIEYDTANSVVKLPDIFTFLTDTVCTEPETTPEAVKSALQGLYSSDGVIRNSVESNVIGDERALAQFIIEAATNGVSDRKFGAAVNYMAKSEHAKIGEIEQFSILASGGKGANQQADRQLLNGLGYTLDTNKTYVLLTVHIDSDEIIGGDNSLAGVVPNDMYITFILEYRANRFILSDFVINNMSLGAKEALMDLIGIDQSSGSISEQADSSMSVVNELLGRFITGSGSHGFADPTDSGTTVRGVYKVNR